MKFSRPSLALASICLCALFLILLNEVVANNLTHIDSSIMFAAYGLRTPNLTTLMTAISFLGGNGLVIVLVLASIRLILKRQLEALKILVITTLGGELLNILLKYLIARPRPMLTPLATETSFSFPSGHAMDSTIVYLILVYGLWRYTTNNRQRVLAVVLATILITAIGFSRIYLGVHYPSDVIGGYLAGLAWLTFVLSNVRSQSVNASASEDGRA